LHRLEVNEHMTQALTNHLQKDELCNAQMCDVNNIRLKCDVDTDVGNVSNMTCLDEDDRTEFFLTFNVTLRNEYVNVSVYCVYM